MSTDPTFQAATVHLETYGYRVLPNRMPRAMQRLCPGLRGHSRESLYEE